MKYWRMPHRTEQPHGVDGARPEWFAAFLADRGTRKPSAHTLKASRQDFAAIATLIAGGEAQSPFSERCDRTTQFTITTSYRHRFAPISSSRPPTCECSACASAGAATTEPMTSEQRCLSCWRNADRARCNRIRAG